MLLNVLIYTPPSWQILFLFVFIYDMYWTIIFLILIQEECVWTHFVEAGHDYKTLDTGATLLLAVHTTFKVSNRLFFQSTFFPDWNVLKHVLNFEKMSSLVKTSKGMDSMLEVKYLLAYFAGSGMKCWTTERRSSSQIHEIDWSSLLRWKTERHKTKSIPLIFGCWMLRWASKKVKVLLTTSKN